MRVTPSVATLQKAATEIAKSVPEMYAGQHVENLKAILGEDPGSHEARLAALGMLVYQVSNNLVEDADQDEDDDDVVENKYQRIINLFRAIGVDPNTWQEHFGGSEDRSSRAFAEKLFEAAINTGDLDILEALLSSGIDPNQPVMTLMNCRFERPIQAAADDRVRGLDMAKLLVKAGADVDGTTPENDMPALHSAADGGMFEMVRFLVESGADIYRRVVRGGSQGWDAAKAPLSFAAASHEYHGRRRSSSRPRSGADMGESVETEQGGLQVLRYLVALYQKRTLCLADQQIIQDALLTAAGQANPAMVEVLHKAGGDVSKANRQGITPLMAAASHPRGDTRVASYLLCHGATINQAPGRLSALHIAACQGHLEMVTLLIENGADINLRAHTDALHGSLLGDDLRPSRISSEVDILSYTPLQLSLHRMPEHRSRKSLKTDEAAIALLNAGAKLVGGELVDAVRFLSRRLVYALLAHGADPNRKASRRLTALEASLVAFRHQGGNGESVSDLLIDSGAAVTRGTMYLAFAAGDTRLVQFLLSGTATPSFQATNDVGPRGESLLEGALLSKSQPLVDMAWEIQTNKKADVDPAALCAAIHCQANGGPAIVAALLERWKPRGTKKGGRSQLFSITALGMCAYYAAAEQLPLTVLEKLIALLPFSGGCSSCQVPFAHDSYYSYTDLIQGWGYKSFDDTEWWRRANLVCCSPLVPVLLAPASRNMRWAVMRMLLRAGYRPDPLSFLMTIWKGTDKQVKELLRRGANANQPCRYDLDSPLQLAVRRGDIAITGVLLSHGAAVNGLPPVLVPFSEPYSQEPNEFRPRSALQLAVEMGRLDLIDLLTEAGADVNGPISIDGGATALQCAASRGFLGIARTLIEAGAVVNFPRAERNGRTALEGAAEMGRLDMVQFLLEKGAETSDSAASAGGGCDDGHANQGRGQFLRAIGLARRNGHEAVARLLENWRELSRYERRCAKWYSVCDADALEIFYFPDDNDMDEILPCHSDDSSGSDNECYEEDECGAEDKDEDDKDAEGSGWQGSGSPRDVWSETSSEDVGEW